jgi:hypothetical protein
MRRRRLSVVVLVIIAVLVASEVLLPYFIAGLVARAMQPVVGTDALQVKTTRSPAVYMLGGSFDLVDIQAAGARIDKITFSDLHAVLSDVQLDMEALLVRRTLVLKTVRDVDLTAVITQEELSRFLNQSVRGVKNAVVTIAGGKVQVSSNFALGPIAQIAIVLDGRIVGDGQKLKFVTERFLLNNTAVGNIGGALLTEIQLVDLKKLPFGVGVRSISMEDGKVVIYSDNRPK